MNIWEKSRSLLTFRVKLVVVLAALSVAPLIWVGVAVQHQISEAMDLTVQTSNQSQLAALTAHVSEQVETLRQEATQASRFPAIRGILRARAADGYDAEGGSTEEQWRQRLGEIFASHLETHGNMTKIRLLDSRGMELMRVIRTGGVVKQTPESRLQDKSERYYVLESLVTRDGECYVLRLDLDEENGEIVLPRTPVLRAAVPIWIDGDLQGIVVVSTNPAQLLAGMEEVSFGAIVLADEDGFYLYHPEADKLFARQLGGSALITDDWPELGSLDPPPSSTIVRGEKTLQWTRIPVDGARSARAWVLGVEWTPEQYYASHFQIGDIVLGTAVTVGLVAIILALVVALFWARPLRALSDAARRLRGGDFSVRVPDWRGDELGEVGRAFNAMAIELGKHTGDLETQIDLKTAALRKTEARNRGILEASTDGILLVDGQRRIVMTNPAVHSLTGYSAGELDGEPVEVLVPASAVDHESLVADYFRAPFARQMGGGKAALDIRVRRKDGSHFPADISLSPLQTDGGQFVSAVVRDVSEREAAEAELARHRQNLEELVAKRTADLRKLSEAVEQSPVTVVITDKSGAIEYVNPMFTETTGYSREAALNQNPRILKSGNLPDSHYANLWSTITAGEIWRGEFINVDVNGREFWEQASISPIRDSEGEITHYVAVKEDITDQKRVAVELAEARDAADAANRAKSDFLARMSHEIRTPMNAVMGMTHLLQSTVLSDKQRDYAGKIDVSTRSLLRIINDILDFSKIEAGKLDIEKVGFNLNKVLEAIRSMMGSRAHEKGLQLVFAVERDVPHGLTGDVTRLEQVLVNLVSNAVKFTSSGQVLVEVAVVSRAGDEVTLQFSVSDTGPGLTEEQISRLFQPFMQADGTTTRRFGGTGLGLAICKRLVKLMGGEIGVRSTLGQGSTFHFTVLLKENSDEANEDLEQARLLEGIRVLVVDDNSAVRASLGEYLEGFCCMADGAASIDEAMSAIKSLWVGSKETYGIVLIDCSMTGKNGTDSPSPFQDIPIEKRPRIIVTGQGRCCEDEEWQRKRESWADAFLEKPVNQSLLLDAIMTALGERIRVEKARLTGPVDHSSVHGRRILLARVS